MTVDLDGGAGIGSWDIRAVRHALAAVMRRRPEAYHATLRASSRASDAGAWRGRRGGDARPRSTRPSGSRSRAWPSGSSTTRTSDGPADPGPRARHAPRTGRGRRDRARRRRRRRLRGRRPGTGRLVARREADHRHGPHPVDEDVHARRRPARADLDPQVDLEHRGGPTLDARLGLEWSTTMLGGGGNPAAWWEVGGARTAPRRPGERPTSTAIAQGNDYIGVSRRRRRWTSRPTPGGRPIETVSNSEDGFERVYQGSGLLLSWPVTLVPADAGHARTIANNRGRRRPEARPAAEDAT